MAGREQAVAAVRGRVRHPSTSPRTTMRHPGRRLGKFDDGSPGLLRPGCRAVGLRQVDGMPHELVVGDRQDGAHWVSHRQERGAGHLLYPT